MGGELMADIDALIAEWERSKVGMYEGSFTEAGDALAAALAEQSRLLEAAEAEVERLHSWDGLMGLLDEHWPAEIFPTLPDSDQRDSGPRIVSLLRWVDAAEAALATARAAITEALTWIREDAPYNSRDTGYVYPEGPIQEARDVLAAVIRAAATPTSEVTK